MESLPPPSKVPKQAIKMAVRALLDWKAEKSKTQKAQLLPTDEFLYLVLTLTKIPPKSRVNAYKIPLPHPLYAPDTSEFCLFVHDTNSKLAKAKISEEGLPISQVIKLTKLKKDYKAYEQKRKLCDSYDVFFADKKVVPLLPNAIGSGFYKKKKVPVPVELGRGNWRDQIDRVCSSGQLYLSTGSCSVVRVAKASMEMQEIVENVIAAVEGVAGVVPRKWANVRSFHLKFSESLALPIYQKVPDSGMRIGGSEMEGKKLLLGEENQKVGKPTPKKGKEEDVKVSGKKKKKKGRIHEVRYLDEPMVGEDESGSVSEGEELVDEEELVGKKRKMVKAAPEKKVKKVEKDVKLKKVLGVKKLKKNKVLV